MHAQVVETWNLTSSWDAGTVQDAPNLNQEVQMLPSASERQLRGEAAVGSHELPLSVLRVPSIPPDVHSLGSPGCCEGT